MIKLGPKQLEKLQSLTGQGWVHLEGTPFEIRVEAHYPAGYFDIRFGVGMKGRQAWDIVRGHNPACVCLTCLGLGR